MQNRCVCKMKDIVKSIPIRIANVIGQRIADKDAVPLHITASAAALINRNLKMTGKLLFFRKLMIKVWQTCLFRIEKAASSLNDVLVNHFGKSDLGRTERSEIPVGESRHTGARISSRSPQDKETSGRLP